MFGNPETTTGGNALKFYSSVRIDIRKSGATLKSGTDAVGTHTKVKIVKNKVAPPFREAEFDIMYGTGIDIFGDLIDLAVKYDIVEKSGSWFSYNKERLGQGKDKAKEFLKERANLVEDIEKQVRDRLQCFNRETEEEKNESQ